MKTVLVFVLFAISSIQVVFGATLADIKTRLVQEQALLRTQSSDTKTLIQNQIANTKSSLNAKADNYMSDMRAGPAACQVWVGQIQSIQKSQINFMYQFQQCEMSTRFINLRRSEQSLRDLMRSADKIQALCAFGGFNNCQSSINSLDGGLNNIHTYLETEFSVIQSDSDNCIERKSAPVWSSLDRVYEYWKKCVVNL